jgi:hypothetical protein
MFQASLQLLHDPGCENGYIWGDVIFDECMNCPMVRVPVALPHGVEECDHVGELFKCVNRRQVVVQEDLTDLRARDNSQSFVEQEDVKS